MIPLEIAASFSYYAQILWLDGATSRAKGDPILRQDDSAKAATARRKGPTRTGPLTKALNKAIAAHGRAAKNRASIRHTAPDTGGRPYHFGYSKITRNSGAQPGPDALPQAGAAGRGSAPGANRPSPFRSTRSNQAPATGEGAYQIYIERDGAIDPNSPVLSAALNPGAGLDQG